MASTILQLSQLISDSVAELIDIASKNNLHVPELNEKFHPESEVFRNNSGVAKAADVIAAATFQLAACVLPPREPIIQTLSGHYRSAALRVSIECHVAEILRDAGPEGLHIDVIAAYTGVDSIRLARLLRLLANRHIFREVRPDYFVNNRISGLLDTGKSIEKILEDPTKKHDGTDGFVAFAEHTVTSGHKGSAYIMENMKDPVTAFSGEPNHAPLQKALQTKLGYFDWYTQPEYTYDRLRFGIAMKGLTAMIPKGLMLDLFNWSALPKDSLVVDIGGGIGSSCLTILEAYPDLRCVVQDLPAITEDGIKHWEQERPTALASGRMKFQGHNFFGPQPITDASVFLLKSIIHDWSDPYAEKIFTHLRNSARPDTILLICDVVMTYSCREPSSSPETEDYVVVNSGPSAPELLTTGFNSVNDMVWTLDAAMLALHNTRERTIIQLKQLLTKCGWRITEVIRRGSSLDSVQAIPI